MSPPCVTSVTVLRTAAPYTSLNVITRFGISFVLGIVIVIGDGRLSNIVTIVKLLIDI